MVTLISSAQCVYDSFNNFPVIFFAGKRLYKIREPEGNVVLKVIQCISVSTFGIIMYKYLTTVAKNLGISILRKKMKSRICI